MSKQILETQGRFNVDTASSVEEAFEKLEQTHYDVVVSDYDMPIKTGLRFLEELKKSANDIPFILFTGKGREEIAVRALNLGAFRYVNKIGDPEVVYTELASCIQQAANHVAAQRLAKQTEERFRAIFEASSDGIVVLDDEGVIVNLNEAALQMFRCTKEVVGQCFFERFSRQFPKPQNQLCLKQFASLRLTAKEK